MVHAPTSLALARIKREPLADLPIAEPLDQALRDQGHAWRERRLTPLVTLRLMLIQVLAGNCAIVALRQLAGVDFAPSSYCAARDRLSLGVLQWLLQWLHGRAAEAMGIARQLGPRILVVDGSSYSMPDTPQLRAQFDLPPGTKAGVGYPMGKLMGLLDLATGMFVSLLALPLFTHDMRGVVELHPTLREGDILLGDRAFCSFCHFALLSARGCFACMRLHQRRKEKSSGCSRTYVLSYDASGNVTLLLDATSGAVVASYKYAPYGAVVSATGPEAGLNPFGFKGYWTDAAVGPSLAWSKPAIGYGANLHSFPGKASVCYPAIRVPCPMDLHNSLPMNWELMFMHPMTTSGLMAMEQAVLDPVNGWESASFRCIRITEAL